MSCTWSKETRAKAKRDKLPLIFLAVDGWNCENRYGKLELSGTVSLEVGRYLDTFIHALVRGHNIEEAHTLARQLEADSQ